MASGMTVERRGVFSAPVLCATTANTAAVLPAHLVAAHAVFFLDEFGIGVGTLGVILALFFGTSAVLSLVAGHIADRVDPVACLIFSSTTSFVAFISISFVQSAGWLVAVLLVAGSTNALAQPAGNVLIHRYVPMQFQGASFGMKMGAIPLSGLIAGLLVTVAAIGDNWRRSFLLAALLALTVTVACYRLGRRQSRTRAAEKRIDARDLSIPAMLAEGMPEAPGSEETTAHRGLGWSTIILAAAALGGAAAASTIGGFYVLSAVDHGFSITSAGLLLIIGSVGGLLARLGWGHLADRFRWDGLLLTATLLGVGALAIAGLSLDRSWAWLFYIASILSFATAWGWPGLLMHSVVKRHADRPGFATSVIQMGIFAGGTIGPLTYGLIAASRGYEVAWLVMGAILILASGGCLIGARAGQKGDEHSHAE